MRYILVLLAAIHVLSTTHTHAFEKKGTSYGKPLTLSKITKVSHIMANPGDFIGKTVLVKGVVVNVCSHRGCWMDIASDAPFEKIRIKVADGEIVFPLDAKGKEALVEGVLEKLEFTKEQIIQWRRHHAEKHGETFDPGSVTSGETHYRIRGTGAVIKE